MSTEIDRHLLRGRVLVELGWLPEAEIEAARALEQDPDHLDALSLCAKIKHMKGELSQAIACWAQIHAQSMPGTTAALAPTYKVSVLGDAWLAEVHGDLEAARELLEELGCERGYEHDLDRLCALVRVYDQIGTPDALEAGAKICRHLLSALARTGREKLSMLGQLASLERRVGRVDAADELEAQFLDATRRRMHRASLHDLLQVAALEYVPIVQLERVRPADERVPAQLDRRERALLHALCGEPAAAHELFASGPDAIDRYYEAELAALAGDGERAVELFLEALRDGSDNPHVVGWLLDRHARSPSLAVARHWADPERRERTRLQLEADHELAPQRVETWQRLATLHRLGDRNDDATRCLIRAEALAAAREQRIGRVIAASVYHLAGRPKGLLHEIWVHRTPTTPGGGGGLSADDIHGNVTPELRAMIRNTFVAVREYARAKLPDVTADIDDFTYSYKLPKEDEPSGGLSAGLPSALAFLSVFLQRPVANALASSGALICEAHDVIAIGRIGDSAHKVRAAYHGNLSSLILPLANRGELERSTLVPHAIASELVHYVADLDHAMKLAFGPDVFTRP